MPFADALEAAEKRLKKAQKERDEAVKTLTCLDGEIPALQTTISALRQQLNPSKIGQPEHPQTVALTNLILKAQEMVAADPANLTEDDLLPEPDGVPLVEE